MNRGRLCVELETGVLHEDRLAALRGEIRKRKLDGFVVARTDEHLSEYIGTYAQRLAWLTGFEGSAGQAVVLTDEAAIFVDGRYELQVREQVDGKHWSYQSIPHDTVPGWLSERIGSGARIGYDPWHHTKEWLASTQAILAELDATLVAQDNNAVDVVWHDRPRPSGAQVVVHPEELAGQASSEKRRAIAAWLASKRAHSVVLSALDSIAWTFNVRGQDIEHFPVALAFAVVHADCTSDLFVAPEKLSDSVVEHLGNDVRLHAREDFVGYLHTLKDRRVAADPARTVAAIFDALTVAGAKIIDAPDPVLLPKGTKNSVEIAGHKAAQARDGTALSRFLYWLSVEAPKGELTEMSAAARLREFREATGKLRDLSFATISAFGPNGALAHYCASERTSRRIAPNGLYLIDSGGQYADGTTDVTRTIAIGEPSAEMRDRFTRVLKGHIALATALFPVGTRGSQLDTLARQYLWAVGLDYAHGTGHGVGAYLAVHEGPQRISPTSDANQPLVPGMILSNEPAYYKAGEYGIRIENLVLVVERADPSAGDALLGFETLTFAPLDRSLIDLAMLTPLERCWIDAYHADVERIVGPQIQGAEKAWLLEATSSLV